MANAPHQDTLYLGLKLYEWLTLLGIIIGPIVAVIITLVSQSRAQKRERKMNVLRALVATHRMPSDATYLAAINLIKIEFNDKPKVMKAWSTYMTAVKFRPTEEGKAEHEAELNIFQTKLIFEVMKAVGLRISETDIQTETYVSNGFLIHDALYLDSLKAMRELADAIKAQSSG
jgi:hypothetical protein